MILKAKGKVIGIFIISPYIIENLKQDRMLLRMDEYIKISRALAEKHGCEFADLVNYTIKCNTYGKNFLSHCGFDFYSAKS